MAPNDKIAVDGITLTERVWCLLADSYTEVGLLFVRGNTCVGQGGFRAEDGGGADASAGTHDHGDVFDLRLGDIPERLWVPLNTVLRSHNVCSWVRSEQYGWTSSGAHIHGVVRDSFYPLSPGATQQVRAYDLGLNGLANDGDDPFPRPEQVPYVITTTQFEEPEMIILRKGASVYRLLAGDEMVTLSDPESVRALTAAGVKVVPIPLKDWPALEAAFGRNGE